MINPPETGALVVNALLEVFDQRGKVGRTESGRVRIRRRVILQPGDPAKTGLADGSRYAMVLFLG